MPFSENDIPDLKDKVVIVTGNTLDRQYHICIWPWLIRWEQWHWQANGRCTRIQRSQSLSRSSLSGKISEGSWGNTRVAPQLNLWPNRISQARFINCYICFSSRKWLQSVRGPLDLHTLERLTISAIFQEREHSSYFVQQCRNYEHTHRF